MNTILTDDERPKLPEAAYLGDNASPIFTLYGYDAEAMEAYADAREAAVLAKLRAGVEGSAAPEAPEQADVHMPRFNDFERKTLLSVATWMEARKGAVWAKQFNFSRLMEKWAKELRAMLAAAPEAPEQAVVQVPQGWRELMCEARDNCKASIAEDGISAMRREYRKELLERMNAMLAAAPEAPAQLEHVTDGTPCWCDPELDYKDPETGAEVWVHRGKQ